MGNESDDVFHKKFNYLEHHDDVGIMETRQIGTSSNERLVVKDFSEETDGETSVFCWFFFGKGNYVKERIAVTVTLRLTVVR